MSRRSDITGGPARNARSDHPSEIDLHELFVARRQIALVWGVEDVQQVRPDLCEERAWIVLQAVADHHDANDGIGWNTLAVAADLLFPEPEETP